MSPGKGNVYHSLRKLSKKTALEKTLKRENKSEKVVGRTNLC